MPAVMRPDLVAEAKAALDAAGGSISEAARALGIARGTLRGRLDYAERTGKTDDFEFPQIEDGEPPIEEVIARMERDYARRIKHHRAKETITIKAKSSAPMALCWFGDPHIDDNGCDWPTLRSHIDIVKSTPGMYACNLGDSTNNWVGNLGRLYAAQDTSKRTAIRLLEWLFTEMPWFLVLAGNHDCVDMETEALTRRGWMRYDDLRDGDEVLSLDPETGVAGWYPILDKFSRANDEPMVRIVSDAVDMLVTPRHRIMVAPGVFVRANELPAEFDLAVECEEGETPSWYTHLNSEAFEEPPADRVWCVTVPLGNFMCRRNGKAHFTGNCWSGDDSPLQWLQNRVGAYSEWCARFKIAFPNGQSFDVNASHDHPGHSQDNPLHGQMKAKIRHPLAQDADLIVAGHRHTAAIACNEDIRRDRPTWYARARGYKTADHYARNLGYPEQKHGQSVVSVINPAAKNPMGLCQCFLDPAEAADYLTFLRGKKTA